MLLKTGSCPSIIMESNSVFDCWLLVSVLSSKVATLFMNGFVQIVHELFVNCKLFGQWKDCCQQCYKSSLNQTHARDNLLNDKLPLLLDHPQGKQFEFHLHLHIQNVTNMWLIVATSLALHLKDCPLSSVIDYLWGNLNFYSILCLT